MMKRSLCAIIALGLFLTLPGCFADTPYITQPTVQQTQPSETQPPQTQPVTTPTENTEATFPQQHYPYPMAAVSLPIITSSRQAEDGTDIFTYSRQTLTLAVQDPMASSNITVDFLNETDFSASGAEAVDLAAQSAYSGQEDWTAYFYSTLFAPTRLDQSVLSLYGTKAYFDGAPHSGTIAVSLTYDLVHGTRIRLNQLLVPNFDSAALCDLIIRNFPAEKAEFFYPDYADVILDMFSGNIPMEDWYLTDQGLCFFFNPGEIAPYSEQIPESTIPYDSLTGLLRESFFPAEQVTFCGAPTLTKLPEGQISNFDEFAEIIVDADGETCCLSAVGVIRNVRIQTGTWSEAGKFTAQATVFAAEAITEKTAVIIQYPTDWLSSLCITYESGGESYSIPATELLS